MIEEVTEKIVGWRDKLLGRGEAAISIPTLDGACKPNRVLEDAEVVASLSAPEDMATDGQSVYVSDGDQVLLLRDGQFESYHQAAGHITAMACLPDGGLALALDGERVQVVGGKFDGSVWVSAEGEPFVAVNALSSGTDGLLYVTDGSARQPYDRWNFDMMELGSTGRVLAIDLKAPKQDPKVLRKHLRYAFGCVETQRGVLVSETWKNQLVLAQAVKKDKAVVDWLPGYPCRMTQAPDGGFWLCAFAGRTHLIEFVLREPAFRKRMMKEVDPRYWIAPLLTSGDDFLEPLQGAHVKTRGVLKPYAPPRSYGLVIKLDARGIPVSSFQSRLDGKNHGVFAAVECDQALYVLAKGPKRVLKINL